MTNKIFYLLQKTNMKTFLWTTLFWIVVAIAWLLCLGFGNLWTQVLDNEWLASVMPENLQTKVCDPVVATTLETIDWCEKAQEADCNLVTSIETWDLQGIQDAINDLVTKQTLMQSEIKDAFASLEKRMLWLNGDVVSNENTLEQQLMQQREQQKKELQAQIEALQAQMVNL